MLRASAMCEAAGIPSVSLVCEGLARQALATSVGLGLPNLPIAVVPGHPGTQSQEELRTNILTTTADAVIRGLTGTSAAPSESVEPGTRDIVFRGDLDGVNRYFYEHELSDGLPVVPPTRERVEAFLNFTDLPDDHVVGALLPDNRQATVWSVAVNGVMAGCRPEYMPILVGLVEAMADPAFGVEHCGNTPGGETLIILNRPIIQELGFNYTQGALRDGVLPNTSVGLFWRLYLRNVAGFLPHKTDKATFGNTWRVVLAENEEVLHSIGWEPNSVEMGFRLPIAERIGVDSLQFGILLIMAIGIGIMMPPVGLGFYITCAVGEASINASMKPSWIYNIFLILGFVVVILFPEITLWLPRQFGMR